MTRLEVMRELYAARQQVASLERQIKSNPKRKSVDLAEKLLPSQRKRVECLEAQLAQMPEDDNAGLVKYTTDARTHIRFNLRSHHPAEEATIDPGPIPEFLRRQT